MLRIAFGTTSRWKNRALREALDEIGIRARVSTRAVPSGVDPQPKKKSETKAGSINRAHAALALVPQAEIGIGVEFGYKPHENDFFMHAWATIVDRTGQTYSEQSSTLELPDHFVEALSRGREVADLVEKYHTKSKDPAWKYFGGIIRNRFPFLKEAVRNVLLRYHFRDEYRR